MAQSQLAIQVPVEVLAPQLDLTDVLSRTAAIEELFKTAFIPTDRASQYFRWLDELRLLKQCGRVIGPRDVGKSRSSVHYREEDRKRVSCVKAWSNSSSKRLFSQILKDIHHAAPRGRRHDLRTRLASCLEPFGIELLLVDNADNLQREALVDLKQLHEESGVSIILIGGQDLDSSLQNFDLLTCFPTLFEFDRLDYEDFQKTLRTIELDLLALPQASNLSEGTLFELLAVSTQAQMGTLIKLLTKAVLHSLKKGHRKVDEAILHNIANRYGKRYVPPESRKKSELGEG
ncbi:ATP-binding protein [Phormidium sp. CLA17]|uniref:AAA family ATPase n=1 Tax=Leptolyngbya sp. Cla-17 TaxID=2803751 RepID=UPI001491868D|nr:AAA family ATPase [Leptolyngbya sp. Cla-17]MBM0744081.1 ATP-binding protein [Leptolyngbya sp. Cla-17]